MKAKSKLTLGKRAKWITPSKRQKNSNVSAPNGSKCLAPCVSSSVPSDVATEMDEVIGDSASITCETGNAFENEGVQTESELYTLVDMASEKLKANGHGDFIEHFARTIVEDKLPTDNIALILLHDTVKLMNCRTMSEMRYNNTAKQFWWSGKKLLRGKFVRFMRGFKCLGCIVDHHCSRGHIDPSIANINFAVPDDKVLHKFKFKLINNAYFNM